MRTTTLRDSRHAIPHSKVMIIDRRTVLSGSFNFTKAAEENNAENLLVIRDVKSAAQFEENATAEVHPFCPPWRWKFRLLPSRSLHTIVRS